MAVAPAVIAVAAAVSAAAAVAGTVATATKGGPQAPEIPPPPPQPSTPPEPAPTQVQDFEATPRQAARRASTRARSMRPEQTILTSGLGSTQLPQNVRRTVLG